MFSGIIEELGTVHACQDSIDGRRLLITAKKIFGDLTPGDSVSVGGVCLTVIERDAEEFLVEAVPETLKRSTLGRLTPGSKVNLERAIKFNDRLGGHLVTGHVDTVAKVGKITPQGFSKIVHFHLAGEWSPLLVDKGSVAVDGVSLTIAECDTVAGSGASNGSPESPFAFAVALIPYTLEQTTLGSIVEGDIVNIETDIIARYVARWLSPNLKEVIKNRPGESPPFIGLQESPDCGHYGGAARGAHADAKPLPESLESAYRRE